MLQLDYIKMYPLNILFYGGDLNFFEKKINYMINHSKANNFKYLNHTLHKAF